MESLINLPQVSSERDLKNLRKLYDELEVNIRSLKSLKVNLNEYGALLMPMLMSKISESLTLLVIKATQKDNWKVETVFEILKSELQAREQCGQLTLQKSNVAQKEGSSRS